MERHVDYAMTRNYAWHPDRDKKNVEGPFYTLKGACLSCMLPESEAPTLLSQDESDYDTYFVRQPETNEEIEAACTAIEACCLEALRYGGRDKNIITRLGNDSLYCDYNLAGKLNVTTQQFWGKYLNRIKKLIKYWVVNKIS